jgi:hypothetical protein
MRKNACLAAILAASLLQISSCAAKSMTLAELASDAKSALSFAADADTSLGLFREGRLTQAFLAAHFEYLADEVRRSSQDFEKGSAAQPRLAARVRDCRSELDSLWAALTLARQHSGDSRILAEAGSQIATTRKALETFAAAQ